MVVSGRMIAKAREAKGLGIEQLAARIHMRAAMLAEIEAMERVDPIYVMKLAPSLWPDGVVPPGPEHAAEAPPGWPLGERHPYAVPDHPALRARLPAVITTRRSPDEAFFAGAATLLQAEAAPGLGLGGRRTLGAAVEVETVAAAAPHVAKPWRVDRLAWIRSDGLRTGRLGFARNHRLGVCPNSDPALPFSVGSWIVVDRIVGMRLFPGLVATAAAGAAEAADHLATIRPWADRPHPMLDPAALGDLIDAEGRVAARLSGVLVAEPRAAGGLAPSHDGPPAEAGSRVA